MKVVVLGVGNTLLTDEAIGVRAVEALQQRYRLPPEVNVIDGGTAGMELLESLEDLDQLVIVDCVRVGQPPATVIRRIDDEVPAFFRTKISPHQIGISDVLAALTLRERFPQRLALIGIQPKDLDTGIELTPEVAATIPEVLALVVEELARVGVKVVEKA
ncbi:HyaD/HybD family hydrogenase maturation endopeptidase [Azospira restricta]|uniref:HyaD/HybD family hydrogenase maturation endopeptidase n=1 Tax=Azospira restricta TaxID=404405 RepID=A0A974PXL9_9RHOO|nr:HyaD/HybD family hydrogenase maturation endopeptidase [Azospira restricta]QRJ63124.1 HyaD/HybD family hydrogenase maturation endopeptidase [Azospira restricta]